MQSLRFIPSRSPFTRTLALRLLSHSPSPAAAAAPTVTGKMTTFSDSNFDSASYKDFRPTYGPDLYDTVLRFHGVTTPRNVAIDVACGTGQATLDLARHFRKVIGVEPSDAMRKEAAVPDPADETFGVVEYLKGDDEHFNVPDGCADLVVSAQAAHWFDMPKFYAECRRVLKPHGTVALWGYTYATLPSNPAATAAILHWGSVTMQPYWDVRRQILDAHYASNQPPFPEVVRSIRPTPVRPSPVAKKMTVGTLRRYLKTFSCYKTFKDAERKGEEAAVKVARECGGDPVDKLVEGLFGGKEGWEDEVLEVVWPVVLVMFKLQ
ncbi:hypothetical protein HDU96_003475 [Phlyctochytrium bullatum]|nr:hypothetical protein HDU96_003475 [Phlyctochytrium bullatum]